MDTYRWWVFETVGSRVRICMTVGTRLRPKAHTFTLSPLVRPGKAVALEAQIELWPTNMTATLFSFLNDITL